MYSELPNKQADQDKRVCRDDFTISYISMGEDFLIRYLKNWKYGGFFPKKLIEHACLLGSSEHILNEYQVPG